MPDGEKIDFSIGEVGSKRIGMRDPRNLFDGLLTSREVVHYGGGLSKRPPIRIVCRPLSNTAEGYFLPLVPIGSQENVLWIDTEQKRPKGYQALYCRPDQFNAMLEKHKVVSGQTSPYNIMNSIVGIEGQLNGRGLAVLYRHNQPMNIVTYVELEQLSDDSYTYELSTTIGESLNFYDLWDQISDYYTAIIDNNYVGFRDYYVDGKFVYLARGNGNTGIKLSVIENAGDYDIVIEDESSLTDADAVFAVDATVVAAKGGEGISFTFNLTQDTTIVLAPIYGRKLCWARGTTYGVVFGTEAGVYIGEYNENYDLFNKVVVIDNRGVAQMRAATYKDVIFFADRNLEKVSYIRFDKFSTNAVLSTIGDESDILKGRGGIKKIETYRSKEIDLLFVLMNDGSLVVGSIIASVDDSMSGSIGYRVSYSEWFHEYKVHDLVVISHDLPEDEVYFMVEHDRFFFICGMDPFEAPLYKSMKENRRPALDFYQYLDTKLMFPTKPTIVVIPNKTSDVWSDRFLVSIVAKDTLFDDTRIVGSEIYSRNVCVVITEYISKVRANGYVSGDVTFEYEIWLQPEEYDIRTHFINSLTLYRMFLRKGYRVWARTTTDYVSQIDLEITSENVNHQVVTGAYIGLPYSMFVVTAPMCTGARRLRSFIRPEVCIENISWGDPMVFLSVHGSLSATRYRASIPRKSDYATSQFFRTYKVNMNCNPSSHFMLELESSSLVQPLITTLAINFENSDGA